MSWPGMSSANGRRLSDLDHIRQSVADILTTPIGSRVMRRDYGSLIPELIDSPINPVTRLRVMSACVSSLIRWEPRIRVKNVALTLGNAALTLDISATRVDGPGATQRIDLSIPLVGSV